jgi:hypothetical protein
MTVLSLTLSHNAELVFELALYAKRRTVCVSGGRPAKNSRSSSISQVPLLGVKDTPIRSNPSAPRFVGRRGDKEVNMSMLETALEIGGLVRQLVDLDTGEVCTSEKRKVSLSTCHISPEITFWSGASLMTVKRYPKLRKEGDEQEKQEVIKRGNVMSFTSKSRNRLMRTLAQVERNNLPSFVTLTYPAVYSEVPKVWKRHLDNFIKRLVRKFLGVAGVWKLEPQQRGAPHFHMLIWGIDWIDLAKFVPQAWYEVVGSGDEGHLAWHLGLLGNKHCVQQVESQRGVFWYASKYMSKEVVGFENVGRWWGVFKRENLPLGEVVNIEVTEEKAIEFIRYMRRYMKRKDKKKSKRDYRSLTVICNPDFWLNKLL